MQIGARSEGGAQASWPLASMAIEGGSTVPSLAKGGSSEDSSMNSSGWLHIVRVDIDPSVEEDFNRWYDEEHIPELLACPGWLTARRYVALDGGPRYAAVYEIDGSWVYDTPEYQKAKGFKRFDPFLRNFVRLVLEPIKR
jgi:hypothetical protein